MQGHSQLAGTEARAEVPADLSHGVDDVLAHLLGQPSEVLLGKATQVLGAVDGLQEAHDVRV